MESLFNASNLVLLFTFVFCIETLAEILNLQTSVLPLPPLLQEVQSRDDQMRAARYLKDRVALGLMQSAITLMCFIVLIRNGLFESLRLWVTGLTSSSLMQSLLYAAALMLGQAVLKLPFAIHSTFKIEARYGFNRTTVGTFISDRVKGVLIGSILGGLLFSFVVIMFEHLGEDAYWKIWLGYTAFQFFIVWIAPVTLLPLFLKLSPLPEGELKSSIESYSQKQKFKLDGAWVCDASKRSAKSNAFFTGFGRFRRLVLFDTLIAKHPPAEITAIVAHEAGHFKLGHIWKSSILSALSSLVLFYVIQKLIHLDAFYGAFGVSPGNLGIGLVLAMVFLTPVNFFFSPLTSYFSRKNEYAADRFSVATTGDTHSLIQGLKRLVTENLATLQHHRLYTILHDSHPPLPDRLGALLRLTIPK